MEHIVQLVINGLLQFLPLAAGPFGGIIISVVVNIGLFILVIFLLKQLGIKDRKNNDLINDLKLLLVKSQLTAEEFKTLIESKFFRSSSVEQPSSDINESPTDANK